MWGRSQSPEASSITGQVGSIWTRGSHCSGLGRYQFQSPRSFIVAGSSTPRMMVASIRMAEASPTPNSLKSTRLSVTKIPNTPTMTTRGARDHAGRAT